MRGRARTTRISRPDEPPLLPDREIARGLLETRLPGRFGRVLDRAYAWYEWAFLLIVFPAVMIIFWITRLIYCAFDARIAPPRRRSASAASFPVGAPWRSTPWFPPELIRRLTPPGMPADILRRFIARVTRRW